MHLDMFVVFEMMTVDTNGTKLAMHRYARTRHRQLHMHAIIFTRAGFSPLLGSEAGFCSTRLVTKAPTDIDVELTETINIIIYI